MNMNWSSIESNMDAAINQTGNAAEVAAQGDMSNPTDAIQFQQAFAIYNAMLESKSQVVSDLKSVLMGIAQKI
jgi:hypothetical protein